MPSRRTVLAGTAAAAGLAALPARAAPKELWTRARDGTRLYAKVQGQGPDVVLLHGWPLNADAWDFHADRLAAEGFRVISPDRRGFGRSARPADGYDFDTFADDLDAVLVEVGAREPLVVGYSMGGGEAVRYVTRHGATRKVRGVGVIAGAATLLLKASDNPGGADASVFQAIKDGLTQDRPGFLKGFLSDVYYDVARGGTNPVTPQVLDWTLGLAMQGGLAPTLACVDAFARTDFRAELPTIRQPTLIVHGTADIPVPIDISARLMRRTMPNARLIEYANGSHGIAVTERARLAKDLAAWAKTV